MSAPGGPFAACMNPMKIIPPATEKDRYRYKTCMESALHRENGGHWRVDIIPGRYGWYARAVPVPERRNRRSPRQPKAPPVLGRAGRQGGLGTARAPAEAIRQHDLKTRARAISGIGLA